MAKFPDMQDLVKKRRRRVAGAATESPGVGLGAPAGSAVVVGGTRDVGRVGSPGKVTPAPPAPAGSGKVTPAPPAVSPVEAGVGALASWPPVRSANRAPVGSEEHARAAGGDFQRDRDAADEARRDLERRANREYRRVPYRDERGNLRYRREYSDDGGATWVTDPSGEGEFERVYQSLDAGRALLAGAPKNFAEWYARRDPAFGDWQDLGQLSDMVGEITRGWEQGGLGEEAYQEAARMLGFVDAQEMRDFQRSEREQLPRGLADAQGLSEEELDLRRSQHANSMRMLQEQADRDIDAIYGESGSSMRAFQAADSYRRQIVDANARHQYGLIMEDTMRREADFDAKLGRYQLLSAQGLAGQQAAVQMIMQDRASQLQGFALQINTAAAQNQQLQALSAHDQAMVESMVSQYNAISDRELGLDLAISHSMDKAYERHVRPAMISFEARMQQAAMSLTAYQSSMSARMQQLQIESQERIAREQAAAQRSQGLFGFIGQLLGVGAGILISAVFPPAAPVVAAVGGAGAVSRLVP